MSKQFRIFRNHYICDDCPNEWTDEMFVISHSWCPCCDMKCEPYSSESLLEDVNVTETEEIEL